MRQRILVCFVLFSLLSALASASEIPETLSDLQLGYGSKPNFSAIKVVSGRLMITTDWEPAYAENHWITLTYEDGSINLDESSQKGTYFSDITSHTTSGIEAISLHSIDESQENYTEDITLDGLNHMVSMDIVRGDIFLSYGPLGESEEYGYFYGVKSTEDTYQLKYAITFDDAGQLIDYRYADADHYVWQYDSSGALSSVEAIVEARTDEEVYSRLYWDFDQRVWRDKDGKIVEGDVDGTGMTTPVPPNATKSTKAPEISPTPSPTPTSTATAVQTSAAPDATITPSATPTQTPVSEATLTPLPIALSYVISAPPSSLQEITTRELSHLPLGNLWLYNHTLTLQDMGYSSVSIEYEHNSAAYTIPLVYDTQAKTWGCAALPSNLPEISHVTVRVQSASGTETCFQDGEIVSSSLTSIPGLKLLRDNTYLYDGTGKENVSATYDSDGTLVSYSFHSQDGTRAIRYTPYGDVLTYSAVDRTGTVYQYDAQEGWKKQDAGGAWVSCDEPTSVSFQDLPPLLLWEKTSTTQTGSTYQWYANNTTSVIGIPLREYDPELTGKWFHVLPVDLSVNGTQSFRLVASNMYYIGTVLVLVQDDNVMVDYTLSSGHVYLKKEFFCWFTSMDEITHAFLENPTDSWKYRKVYSKEEHLKGQDIALLFVNNIVTYRKPVTNDGAMLTRYWPNTETNKQRREEAKKLLMEMEMRYAP